jgi:NADPH-dependent curcumin reductase CurA
MRSVLVNRLTIRGFIVFDFSSLEEQFLSEVSAWIREGKISYREDIRDGFENAPATLIDLLQGGNFGKMLLRTATG